MRKLMTMFSVALLTVLAALATEAGAQQQQCRPGQACYRGPVAQQPRYVHPTFRVAAPAAPAGVPAGAYYLADATGKTWYSLNPGWVEAHVASVNATAAPAAPMAVAVVVADPLREVNAARARRNLHSLIHDPAMSSWAAANNAEQARRGKLGHHVNNGYGQCAGWNYASAAAAVAGWSGSAGHAVILYSPSVRYAGLAINGAYSTLNVR